MAAPTKATVQIASLRNYLCNLPDTLVHLLAAGSTPPQQVVVEFVWSQQPNVSKQHAFAGWTGVSSRSQKPINGHRRQEVVEVDASFAKDCGLSPGMDASLFLHLDSPLARTVYVEPLSPSDWEILELHAAYLETNMISQIRAVTFSHSLTVHLSTTSIAQFKVTKIDPSLASGQLFAKLSPEAEVVVAPKTRRKIDSARSRKSTGSTLKKRNERSLPSTILRSISLPHPSLDALGNVTDLTLFADDSLRFSKDFYGNTHVEVSVLRSAETRSEVDKEMIDPASRIVATLGHWHEAPPGHVAASERLALALGIQGVTGAILRIWPSSDVLLEKPKKLVVHPFSNGGANTAIRVGGSKRDEIEMIKDAFEKSGIFRGPVTNRLRVAPVTGTRLANGGLLRFDKIEGGWTNIAPNVPLELGEDIKRPQDIKEHQPRTSSLVCVESILESLVDLAANGANSLLTGPRGSGKSVILQQAASLLRRDLFHVVSLPCMALANDKMAVVKNAFHTSFCAAMWHAPTVLLMDDVDRLMPAESEQTDSSRTRQVAELFVQIFHHSIQGRKVVIIATTQSKDSLHPLLVSSHVFRENIQIKAPTRESRTKVLNFLMQNKTSSAIDLIDIASNTDGYYPADLKVLVERAQHYAVARSVDESHTDDRIASNDIQAALVDFVPQSLKGVKLQKSQVKWSDIGGLGETKQVLLETLEWPTKFAPIFAKSPLRLRSGLLLYGFPGCGKTLLASAVASECGLNFISVKGPEILNKYIGASEKSVRDLFDRAQSARPCVLFFDEFDSIAPKRGHDSTGVTDRVVNQMLTQMDGAEGLEGVYVLAATSRPDLIDSALLRPGRLDKALCCSMPDEMERYDVLRAFSKKMALGSDVDLKDLANSTEHYSGADLQALMYDANLVAIHQLLDQQGHQTQSEHESTDNFEFARFTLEGERLRRKGKGKMNGQALNGIDAEELAKQHSTIIQNLLKPRKDEGEMINLSDGVDPNGVTGVVVQADHIRSAFQSSRPSISSQERTRLQAIYDQFIAGRNGELPSGTASNEIGGRSTLM